MVKKEIQWVLKYQPSVFLSDYESVHNDNFHVQYSTLVILHDHASISYADWGCLGVACLK